MIRFVMTDMIPILAFLIGALTIFIPVIIAKAKHAYFGGLVWPFINDLSRDYPSSALFATGINLLTLLLSLTWFLNYRRHERSLQLGLMDEKEVRWFKTLSNTCNFLGIFGACFLPIYQTTRGSRSVTGTIFFVFEACACIINSYLSYRDCLLKREELETGVFVTIKYAPRSVAVEKLISLRKAKRAFVMELACTALFLVSALVYLPIMYEVEPARRVTIEECISMGLGDHYCNDIVRYNETETILWNYDLDFAGYQVRAFAQLTCILTLLTYTLSFVVNSDIEETKNNERDHMYHSAVSRNTPLLGSPRDEQDDYPSSGRRRRSRSRPTSPSKPVSSPRIRSPSNSPTKREQRRSVTSPRSTTSSTHTNSSSTNRPKHYISV